MTNCKILHLLSGAKEATGLTVIIDVFRAFSLECYLYDLGAALVRPAGSIEEARALHEKLPGSLLIGERQGIKVEGFDFGNSPSQVQAAKEKISGKVIIHTTSAGTQGIVNAHGASEIVTGSLVNASAVAKYAHARAIKEDLDISLVAMGLSAKREAAEDELCAEYIRSLIEEKTLPALEERRQDLKNHDGRRFFDPSLQEHFPEKDYYMCIEKDLFPFVLRIGKDDLGFFSEKIDV